MAAADPTVKYSNDLGVSATTVTDPVALSPIVESLNAPETFSFSLKLHDSQALSITKWATEIQVFRGSDTTPSFVGPVIDVHPDPVAQFVTFTCGGLLSYYEHRNMDRGAGRHDLLEGLGGFENASSGDPLPSPWTIYDPDSSGLTAVVDNSRHVAGLNSIKLTQTVAGARAGIQATVTVTAGGVGDLITGKAWYWVDAATWGGPALEGWGFILRQVAHGTTTPVGGEAGWSDANKITSDTGQDQWNRVVDTSEVPASTTLDIEVRLVAPKGVSWWDEVAIFKMESFSPRGTHGVGVDQASILIEFISFLNGTHTDFTGIKSDLRITADGTSCPATGVLRLVSYQFADHVEALTALTAFCGLDDGVDIWIDKTRVFHCASPTRGTDRTGTVTLTPGTNCEFTANAHEDGRESAGQVVQLWVGDGPDREEVAADDVSGAYNGITLQKILQPKGSPSLDSLPGSAAKELAASLDPKFYELVITDRSLIGVVGLGDTVTLAFNEGRIQESGTGRIITYTLDPNSDLPTVGLNVVS